MIRNHLGILAFIFIAAFSFRASSQSYSFSQVTAGTIVYQDLAEPIPVTTFNENGAHILTELEGETFWFYGIPFSLGGYKTISMGDGGFMRIDNDSSLIIIDGAFTYMEPIDETSSQSYSIEGPESSRIIKMQYKNMKLSFGEKENHINVQIWYYQQTGVVEIHYGPRSENNATGYNLANGPNVGMFYSADDFTECYEKIWCWGDPEDPNLATAANYTFQSLQGVPAEGTVFRFTPLFLLNSIERNRAATFSVYPNPAAQTLHINGSVKDTNVELLDTGGSILETHFFRSGSGDIDVSHLSNGVYALRLSNSNGTHIEKIIKNE